MCWNIIHIKNGKCQEVLDYFNAQKEVHAFKPMIEKWFSSSFKKEYQKVEMYPDYIFINSSLSHEEFNEKFHDVFLSIDGFAKLMKYDDIVPLDKREEDFLDKMLDGSDTIKHSIGRMVDSILVVEQGPLVGMEDMIKKTNRHKRLAFVDGGILGLMKIPLEVVSKS